MKGIANHASPPSKYAFTQVAGRLAIARCQYYTEFEHAKRTARKLEAGRNPTYGLVLEHSRKVPDDIDYTEDESVLRTHRQVGTLCVPSHGLICRSPGEQRVHRAEAADLLACCVYSKYEDKDDREENRGMCTGKKDKDCMCQMCECSAH